MTDAYPRLEPLESWDIKATHDTFVNGNFHGVILGTEIQKSDDDLLRYQELIETSQPDVVLETGTRAGGSALWFNKEMGLRVVTIDISPQWMFTGGGLPPATTDDIVWMVGSSIREQTVGAVLEYLKDKRVMVSLDSDHHSAHVQAEIATWGPLVSPGCYMVVEDACFDLFDRAGNPDWARVGGARIPEYGGPLDAMEKQNPERLGFWRDEHLEARTPISHSPVGWWRKHE